MSREVGAGHAGTLYRAHCRTAFTRDGYTYHYEHAYGPYARVGDARNAVKREARTYQRRWYPDYNEVWTIEALTGEWQEVKP